MAFTIEHQRNQQWQFRDVIKGQCWAHGCNKTVEAPIENSNFLVKSGPRRLNWPETMRAVQEALKLQGWHLRMNYPYANPDTPPEPVLICPYCWENGMDAEWRYAQPSSRHQLIQPVIGVDDWITGMKGE